ncbi:unnamed protein product [Triticum turgidum subsp. durum]|uniref:R13L1/DRL21-like LRR repeat region domain-containing protein n=1 Tax=Triticum turgidum subsp. durum TaxID=4567 RepID=A0A9R1Q7P5_TRITD|nr:unnamed protein product [Triticum turgidum subsp. durum]
MTLLTSLRCLNLFGTKINQVPKGIGKLKFLTHLRDYPVGDGSDNAVVQGGWNLKELSSLSQMRHLSLVKLERAAHYSINGVLTDKKHLKELGLQWTAHGEVSYSEEDVSNTEKVFEQLIPPHNLEDLSIFRFFGRQYPTWFGTTYLSSLIYLKLVDVRSCVELPPIGQLSNLKFLRIDGAHAVTKVGPKFAGFKKGDRVCNEFRAFPKLEWLIFKDMPNWEVWSSFEEEVADDGRGADGTAEIRKEDVQSARLQLLPCLVSLQLVDCPKLRALPPQLGEDTASLKQVVLIGINNLMAMEDFPLIPQLIIKNCEGLERVCNLPLVTDLRVLGCPNLKHVEGLASLQQLGLGEDMQQEISSRWVPELQEQHRQLHGEDLDVYTWSTHRTDGWFASTRKASDILS